MSVLAPAKPTPSPTPVTALGLFRARTGADPPGTRLQLRGSQTAVPVKDPDELLRLKGLAIPPAWVQVWICADSRGHLQATGIDAAGRKQYLYHERWRELRDRQKFDHMVDFAKALPRLRKRILSDLEGDELDQPRVLACAVRLLDVGLFRIGSEQYADDEGGVGLATVTKDNVRIDHDEVVFDYLAKGGTAPRTGGAGPHLPGGGARAEAQTRRGRAAAGVPRPAALARRALRADQRVPQGADRRAVQRQGLPNLERDRAGGRLAGRRWPRRRAPSGPANGPSTGR